MASLAQRMKEAMELRNISQAEIVKRTGIGKSSISTYLSGEYEPKQRNIYKICEVLNVSEAWLMGHDVPMERHTVQLKSPAVTTDTVVLPVIGNIAAGYNEIAIEDWSGETVEVPASYLKGRNRNEFIVLKVHGDSMYPEYHNGDKVVILKQSSLSRSGAIGAVLYDGENATLKRVEYIEDKIKLIPLNPTYPPKTITGADCESVRIIGIPKVLIRDIEE